MPFRKLDSGSVGISFRDEGPARAPALVLLHGFPFSSELWTPQIEVLSADYRVIAPDFRGFGGSDLAPGPFTMERLAADTAELLDLLSVQRAAVAGLSMGGYVAFELYRGWPQRVAGLLLADTRPHPDSPEAQANRAALAEVALKEGSRAVADRMITRLLSPQTVNENPDVEVFLSEMMASAPPEAIAAALEGMALRSDSRPLLPKFEVPVQVVVGEDDAIAPPDEAHEWAAQITDVEVEVIAGAGHVSNLERPRAFNRILKAFLQKALPTVSLLTALALGGCGGVPEPPLTVPEPDSPSVEPLKVEDTVLSQPELKPPLPMPPEVTWFPSAPAEGTVVALLVNPAHNGIPVLEVWGRNTAKRERGDLASDLALTKLAGGAYMAFIAAPLDSHAISLEITAYLVDGSRLTQSRTIPVRRREFPSTQVSVSRRFTEPDAESIARSQRERALIRATLRIISADPLLDGPFVAPRSDLSTSPFGQRRMFNSELRSRHTGHDIDGDLGDPIYAANSGRIVLARDFFFNGNAIYIDHGLGLYTSYMHLSEFEGSEGEWVERGQLIGRVGATGRVTGPHLHWGLYHHGTALDPMSVFHPDFVEANEILAKAGRNSPPVLDP